MNGMNGTNGVRGDHASVRPSPAALFTVVWNALADLLGTAAAAMLLRRATWRASQGLPELLELSIVRENLEYRYTLPTAWHDRTVGTRRALRRVVAELLPLLEELTGPLVIGHLAQIDELRDQGIIPLREEEP